MCSCLSCTPYWGPSPRPRQACALTGNRTGDPLVSSPVPNPLSHTSQGSIYILYHVSSAPRILLGTQYMLNNYLLNAKGMNHASRDLSYLVTQKHKNNCVGSGGGRQQGESHPTTAQKCTHLIHIYSKSSDHIMQITVVTT